MTILEKMLERCEQAGYATTKNVEKIAKAKTMMFGEKEWQRCPCDGNNEKALPVPALTPATRPL